MNESRRLRTLFLYLCASFPSIIGQRAGFEFGADFGSRVGLAVGCIASFVVFWVIVNWSRNRDLIQSMAVGLGIPVGSLTGELSSGLNESWTMLVLNCALVLLGLSAMIWAFSDLWTTNRSQSASEA